MSKITIVVAGEACTGKSFIKHQIAKHLNSLGLHIEVEEYEHNMKGIMARRDNPDAFVQAIKEKQTTIEVTEQQLTRSFKNAKNY
jgi:hypothetical protein